MKISVITVSYNAVDVIERTIQSVARQRYDDYTLSLMGIATMEPLM